MQLEASFRCKITHDLHLSPPDFAQNATTDLGVGSSNLSGRASLSSNSLRTFRCALRLSCDHFVTNIVGFLRVGLFYFFNQTINCPPIPTRDEMPIGVNRDLNRMMPKLVFYIR